MRQSTWTIAITALHCAGSAALPLSESPSTSSSTSASTLHQVASRHVSIPIVRRGRARAQDSEGLRGEGRRRATVDEDELMLARGEALVQKYSSRGRTRRFEEASQRDREVEGAARRRRRRAVELINQGLDSEYLAQIHIGTPPRPHYVIVDSGSADIWLAAKGCQAGCSETTPLYDPSASSTSRVTNEELDIVYGSAVVKGSVGFDTITIANHSLATHPIGVINSISTSSSPTPRSSDASLLIGSTSGLLGLSLPGLSHTNTTESATSLISRLYEQGAIDSPQFSIALARWDDIEEASMDEPGGRMVLGSGRAEETTLEEGEKTWVDVHGDDWWLVDIDDVRLTPPSSNSSASSISLNIFTSRAALDTATRGIAGPLSAMESIYESIPGAKVYLETERSRYWSFPCRETPNVGFVMGGREWKIQRGDFVMRRVGNLCIGSLYAIANDPYLPDWILGSTFLKNFMTSFRFPHSSSSTSSSSISPADRTSNASTTSTSISPAMVGLSLLRASAQEEMRSASTRMPDVQPDLGEGGNRGKSGDLDGRAGDEEEDGTTSVGRAARSVVPTMGIGLVGLVMMGVLVVM